MNQPPPPDFEKMTWKCKCCGMERLDKFIKVSKIDMSHLYNEAPGVFVVNVKYCGDVPSCQQKAFDRNWVIKTYFPGKLNDNTDT
jgi:hypothetical protein